MKLLNFIFGVLGLLLILGAFFSFLPLVLLGGIATGNLIFAFGFPIFLMILGAIMVYFGFYYSKDYQYGNSQTLEIIKWGIIVTISLVISNYIVNKLTIVNNLLVILITASIVSIVIQAIMSHNTNHTFKMRWFIFYFLVYSNVIWIMTEYILPKISITINILTLIIMGFTIGGVVMILQKMRIGFRSLPWISFILFLILIVANLSYLSGIGLDDFLPNNSSVNNPQILLGNFEKCPIPSFHPVSTGNINPQSIGSTLNSLIDSTVWRIENDFNICYEGKYKNQYSDWIYCDNLIVSRWVKSNSGTINYRWYTAVTVEWKPLSKENQIYSLEGFSCENGQKVTVEKGETNYYVYDSRDGTKIRIKY